MIFIWPYQQSSSVPSEKEGFMGSSLLLTHPHFIFSCYLNPASVAFAEDTRHQARSRIFILQALYNAVDLVKKALPKGSVFPK